MLLNEAEEQQARTRRIKIFFGAVLIISLLVGAIMLYDILKPLPQTPICEEKGYEGGKIYNGIELCYSGCETNKLNSCSYRGVPK